MPRYEFFCEACKKSFTKILTIAEYDKGGITCPECSGSKVTQQVTGFFAVTSKKS